jgi:hypothetical protein
MVAMGDHRTSAAHAKAALKIVWLIAAKDMLLEMHHAAFAVQASDKAGEFGRSEALCL